MDELEKSIEKLVKAGIGAVSEGISRTQETVDRLAVKGEPLFNQACETVSGAAEKFRKTMKSAMDTDETIDDVKHALTQMGRAELKEIADFLYSLIRDTPAENDPCDEESDEEAAPEEEAECRSEGGDKAEEENKKEKTSSSDDIFKHD